MPTATDLVTDLPADFEVFGQAVDTRLKALQPGTTLGDLAYSSATANTNTRLGIGTSGQVLAVSGGGVPAWTTTADVTPLTTKGDLFTFTTVDARVGVGANGTVLTADSAEATGLKWATPSSGSKTVLTSGSLSGSSVSLTSIPNTYISLELVVRNYRPAVDGSNLQCRVNGDATANRHMATSTSTGVANRAFDATFFPIGFSQDNTGSQAITNVTFPDYANTTTWKNAFVFSLFNHDAGPTAANAYWLMQGYNQTGAITSLDLFPESSTFTSGTYILYGVK